MVELVVFDFDGVVINSEPLMREAFAHSYSLVMRRSDPPIDEYLSHMGKPFEVIMADMRLPLALKGPYSAFSKQNVHKVEIFDRITDLLKHLRARGTNLALLTGKDRERTEELLSHFDIGRHFQEVVTASDRIAPKPSAEGLKHILAQFDLDPTDAIMVGDSVHDMRCATAAGVRGIGVLWGTQPDRLRSFWKDGELVSSVEELWALVDGVQAS